MVLIPRDIIFEIVSYISDLKDIGKCAQLNSIFREYALKREVIESKICKSIPLETTVIFQNLRTSYVPIRVKNYTKLKKLADLPELIHCTILFKRSLNLRFSQLVNVIIGFMEYYCERDRTDFSIMFDFSKLSGVHSISTLNVSNDSIEFALIADLVNYESSPDTINKLIEELYNTVKFKDIYVKSLNGEYDKSEECIKEICNQLNIGYHEETILNN